MLGKLLHGCFLRAVYNQSGQPAKGRHRWEAEIIRI